MHDLSVLDRIVTTIHINQNKGLVWKTGEFDTAYLMNNYYYFKLIEDNNIDIDSINNTNLRFILCKSDLEDDNIVNVLNNFFKENDDNMEQLLKCVKQLNKEIKELKERL